MLTVCYTNTNFLFGNECPLLFYLQQHVGDTIFDACSRKFRFLLFWNMKLNERKCMRCVCVCPLLPINRLYPVFSKFITQSVVKPYRKLTEKRIFFTFIYEVELVLSSSFSSNYILFSCVFHMTFECKWKLEQFLYVENKFCSTHKTYKHISFERMWEINR